MACQGICFRIKYILIYKICIRRFLLRALHHKQTATPDGRDRLCTASLAEHFLFENALLTRKRQPPQRGVHSGENRVFRLNATFDFHKKSKVICSKKRKTVSRSIPPAAHRQLSFFFVLQAEGSEQ